MTTGNDVYRARKNAGHTQHEMATRVGVSPATISYWERKGAKRLTIYDNRADTLSEYVLTYTKVIPALDKTPFDFDRAPETKRRWWQRFGRKA